MADILVVDDEIGIRELLSEILGDEGHEVLQAENAAQARSARNKARPDLVLLDIWMPDTDGIALLREWSEAGLLDMPVIMMSGHATVDMATQATRLGAVGFLEKPIALQKLLAAVQAGLQGKAAMSGAQPRGMSSQAAGQTITGSPPASAHPAMRGDAPPAASMGGSPQGSAHPMTGEAFANVPARQALMPGIDDSSVPGPAMPGSQTDAMQAKPIAGLASPWDLSSHLERDQQSPSARLEHLSLDQPLREARDAFERLYFEHHLAREGGSMTRVAERTGLERTHLYRKLKQLGVELGRPSRRES